MTVLAFTVPGEPVAKGRPRFTRSGFAYPDKKTDRYENLVRLAYVEAYPDRKPAEGPIAVSIKAYFPPLRSWSKKKKEAAAGDYLPKTTKPDLDNLVKVLDGLNKIAWVDDAQIYNIAAWKGYSERPRMEILIFLEEEEDGIN